MGLVWGSFAAMVPVIKGGIGVTDGEFGMLLLLGSVSASIMMLSAPAVARRLGALQMILPMMVMALFSVFVALPDTVWLFAIILMTMTAGSAFLDIVMNTELSAIEARENTGLMGLNHGIFSFAYAFGAIVSGAAREVGLGPVHVFAGIFLICVFLARGMKTQMPPPKPEGATSAKLPVGLIAIIGAVMLIGLFAEISVEQWSALYLERDLGGSAAAGALGPAILGITMGIGRIFGQVLTKWLTEVQIIRIAGVLSAIGMAIVSVAPSVWVAYPGFVLFGFGVSVSFPMGMAIAGRAVDDARRSLMISRVAFVGYTGFFIGPPLMGIVAQSWGLNTSFALVAVLMLVMAGPLCWLLARPR